VLKYWSKHKAPTTTREDHHLPDLIQWSLYDNIGNSLIERWHGCAMGRALDLRSTGSGFKSYWGQNLCNNLGQVVYTYVPLSPSSKTWYWPRVTVTASLVESNGSLPPGAWLIITCGLTVCTPGSAPGRTHGKPLPLPFISSNTADLLNTFAWPHYDADITQDQDVAAPFKAVDILKVSK